MAPVRQYHIFNTTEWVFILLSISILWVYYWHTEWLTPSFIKKKILKLSFIEWVFILYAIFMSLMFLETLITEYIFNLQLSNIDVN